MYLFKDKENLFLQKNMLKIAVTFCYYIFTEKWQDTNDKNEAVQLNLNYNRYDSFCLKSGFHWSVVLRRRRP